MTTSIDTSPVSISISSLMGCAKAADALSLKPHHIRSTQAGQHLSALRGRGMEFDELRLYQAGDDIRGIDWKVTARTGKTHTKLYREERERPVIFWLDLRANMFFATRGAFKAVVAAKATALLSWAAYRNSDRIGGLLFSENSHKEVRPRSGKAALAYWFNQICTYPAWQNHAATQTGNNWDASLQRLRKVVRPGSLLIMLSDFWDLNNRHQPHLAYLARHNDVTMLQVNDPLESELPPPGQFNLTDGKQRLSLNTSAKAFRLSYQQHYQQQQTLINTLCQSQGIHHLNIATNDNIVSTLRQQFAAR